MQEDDPCYSGICEVLRNSELFGALDLETRRSIVSECSLVEWRKGETIDPDIGCQYAHIIIRGKMKLTQIDPETGRSMAIFILKPGDIYDFFTLLDGKEHIVFPVPMETIKLLRIPLDRAREWMREHPEFNEAFLPYLGERMRELESFSESLVFHDTTTRLANLILRHTHRCKEENEDHYPVHLINNLSHESLAEMIGSVRAVVTRQMQKLKDEEVVISKRGKLAIKNLEKLMKICDLSKE